MSLLLDSFFGDFVKVLFLEGQFQELNIALLGNVCSGEDKKYIKAKAFIP
ncbi:MAG: hypothetical protein ABRQ27_13370 [Clostridiaceae bacterium]